MPLALNNQTRPIMRDATVCSLANLPSPTGAAGTAIDFLGTVETVEITLKRKFVDVTGAADLGQSSRATMWDNGSVKMSGFSNATQSKFANLFSQGAFCILSFTETATGDVYQLQCRCDDFSKSLGKEANKDSLTLTVEGEPYYGAAGVTPTAMVLD